MDQLKSQDMLKAGDAAEEIQKAASDEIVGMVIADAKEKLDKELEEKKAEAEKKAEEKEEQDERIEKAKEERKEDREMIEGDLDAEKLQADASFQKPEVKCEQLWCLVCNAGWWYKISCRRSDSRVCGKR